MHEKITDIYNSVWKAYKAFLKNGDVKAYTEQAGGIVRHYGNDPLMRQFAENLTISMVPVINALAERSRNDGTGSAASY